MTAAERATTCPVCHGRNEGGAICPACGWRSPDGEVASAPDGRTSEPGEARELPTDDAPPGWPAERLDAARRRFDLRAAVRAAGPSGGRDRATLERLRTLARGLPGPDDELDQVEREVDAADAAAERADEAGLALALTRLVAGDADRLTFLEVGPDAIVEERAVADDVGTPALGSVGARHDWADLLPMLSSDQAERRFQLAGGVGRHPLDPDAVAGALAGALPTMVATAAGAGEVVLVDRSAGWGIPAVAVALIRERFSPIADLTPPHGVPLRDFADRVLRRAPLRHGYDLVLAAIDERTGAVRLDPRPLFPAGTAVPPGGELTAEVHAAVPPVATVPLALPVVVRRGVEPAGWAVLRAGSVTPRGTTEAHVRVALDGPGRLRFADPPNIEDDPRAWADLIGSLPDHVDNSAIAPVDLVCAVELCGDPTSVEARLGLVRDLLDLVDTGDSRVDGVRVGLLGYVDHTYEQRPAIASPAPILLSPLDEPGPARGVLGHWRPSPSRHDYAAPLEDALHALGRMPWRRGSQRVLVTVGTRPPHPPRQGADPALPCPYRHDWRRLLDDAVDRFRLRRLAVAGPPTWAGEGSAGQLGQRHAAEAWSELGADGLFVAGEVTAGSLADLAGLSPGAAPRALPFLLTAPTGALPDRPEAPP